MSWTFLSAAVAVSTETIPGVVTIPLWLIVSVIISLAGVISYLGRALFNLQNQRVDDGRKDLEKVMTALNDNTAALSSMANAIERGVK